MALWSRTLFYHLTGFLLSLSGQASHAALPTDHLATTEPRRSIHAPSIRHDLSNSFAGRADRGPYVALDLL